LRPGEKASEYQRLTMRLPDDSLALLKAIARAVDAPAWRVMVDALRAYVGEAPALSPEQRRAARALLRLKS
jgi:predicted transcriptional regulator